MLIHKKCTDDKNPIAFSNVYYGDKAGCEEQMEIPMAIYDLNVHVRNV